MSDYELRNLSGRPAGSTAKRPGDPGTRRHNRLSKLAEFYYGKSPVAVALASGELDLPLVHQIEEETGMPLFGEHEEQIDPADVVMMEISRSAGFVRDLEKVVRMFEMDDLITDDLTEIQEEKDGDGEGNTYSMTRREKRRQINLLWQLFQAERKHLSAVANGAVKSGLQLRRVQIEEAKLDRIQQALILALSDLGHDTADSRVRQAIGGRIRELRAGVDFTVEPVQVPATREAIPVTPPKPPADF